MGTMAKATLAKVGGAAVTQAGAGEKATAIFRIGDTRYTVNGAEQTMDVAPYIKDGRTWPFRNRGLWRGSYQPREHKSPGPVAPAPGF